MLLYHVDFVMNSFVRVSYNVRGRNVITSNNPPTHILIILTVTDRPLHSFRTAMWPPPVKTFDDIISFFVSSWLYVPLSIIGCGLQLCWFVVIGFINSLYNTKSLSPRKSCVRSLKKAEVETLQNKSCLKDFILTS